jgi:glycosyltransferase involved in cell wall biosynthesis
MLELTRIVQEFDIQIGHPRQLSASRRQSAFFSNMDHLLKSHLLESDWHKAASYFHGSPYSGDPLFVDRFKALCRFHEKIDRIQVTNRAFQNIIFESGIARKKVFRIPIGINLSYFRMQTRASQKKARNHYDLPESAVIVGSFQKDGNGWGEGLEPKKIKGPDILLKTLTILKQDIPELYVLLSGPARGYVKKGLQQLDIPYKHYLVTDYEEVGRLFQCLDLYIISSRDEGGPKAVLESMASGVPLVTTSVGQAADIVSHNENGWIVNVGDYEGLASWGQYIIENKDNIDSIISNALKTAKSHSYESLTPLWYEFMKGFVEMYHL